MSSAVEPRPLARLSAGVDCLERDLEVEELLADLRRPDPGSWQINGPRRIGKSWLLGRLRQELQKIDGDGDKRFCVFLSGMSCVGDQPAAFLSELFRAMRKANVPLADDFWLEAQTKDTAVALRDLLRDWLDDLAEDGIVVVLLVDEFDRVVAEVEGGEQLLAVLRLLHENQSSVGLVVVSALPLHLACPSELAGSPVWNFFRTVALSAWTEDSSLRALERWGTPLPAGKRGKQVLRRTRMWPLWLARWAEAQRAGQELDWQEFEEQVWRVFLGPEVVRLERTHPGAFQLLRQIAAGGESPSRSALVADDVEILEYSGIVDCSSGRVVLAFPEATRRVSGDGSLGRLSSLEARDLDMTEWISLADRVVGDQRGLPPKVSKSWTKLTRGEAADVLVEARQLWRELVRWLAKDGMVQAVKLDEDRFPLKFVDDPQEPRADGATRVRRSAVQPA